MHWMPRYSNHRASESEAHLHELGVERQNLTMRMQIRRFTRLNNSFGKKIVNQAHAIALRYMYETLGRIHQTLRITPPMEAGLAGHIWSIEEVASLLDRSANIAA